MYKWKLLGIVKVSFLKTYSYPYNVNRVGKAKIVTGAGLAGLGLLTGNSGLTNKGTQLAALGVGSKLLAHVIGKRSVPEETMH